MALSILSRRLHCLLLIALLVVVLAGCGAYGTGNNGGGGGSTIPPVPVGLIATAGNAQVSMSWTASNGATLYYVKRSTTSGGPYTQISAPSATSYTDTGLTNGIRYFYVVSAYNSAGQSANSSEVNATPTAPATPPAAPANLQATAGNARVSLSWTASGGATSYHVKRSTTSGSSYMLIAAPAAASYSDTGLTNGTAYYYVVSALNAAGESANSTQATATPANLAADVTITIDPAKTKLISPYIYGINFYNGVSGAPPLLTFDRAGGNRWTAYNWETNASNAGSDYSYQNDSYLSSSNVPAEAVQSFIAGDQGAGRASLVTLQLQGYVSADESGPVARPFPNLSRFKQVIEKKSTKDATPFTTNPPTTDAYVYMDEFAWALDQKFPGQGIFGAAAGLPEITPAHPTFISLDNEPDLWNSTHEEVQGSANTSSDNYIAKAVTLSKALKDQFPNVVIFGPVNYGFNGIYSWQGEASAGFSSSFWFADKYLAGTKTASAAYGKPLVDVYDFHWYSEATDGTTRVINMNGASLTDAQVQAIVQSPRSLWDTTFKENSWITNSVLGGPIYILKRLQAKIDAANPGMKIAITEYENGGFNHIAGTIAQADNLGVFGSEGVFAANFWPPGGTYSYALAGFRAFRGFDGASANFGDTSLQTTSSSVKDVVVYASSDSATPGRFVFVAINRSNASKVTAIDGQSLNGTAHLYQMTSASGAGQTVVQPVSIGTMPVSGSSLTITLPAYSVTTIDAR